MAYRGTETGFTSSVDALLLLVDTTKSDLLDDIEFVQSEIIPSIVKPSGHLEQSFENVAEDKFIKETQRRFKKDNEKRRELMDELNRIKAQILDASKKGIRAIRNGEGPDFYPDEWKRMIDEIKSSAPARGALDDR